MEPLRNPCRENPDAELDDASTWVVINPKAYDRLATGPLRDLLQYLENGHVDLADDLVCDIASAVDEANRDEALRREAALVLTFEEDIMLKMKYTLEDAVKEALEQGLEQGQNLMSVLWKRLEADGRTEEAVAMMTDADLRRTLMSEYKIA